MAACKSPAADAAVLELLIDAGADPNAVVQREPAGQVDYSALLADENLDPQTRELLESSRKLLSGYTPDMPPLIGEVTPEIGAEKLRFLIGRGADVNARSSHGYTAFMNAANRDRRDLMEILLAAGATPDGITSYGESAVGSSYARGKFALLAWLLERGADPAPLEWTALHRAVAIGSPDEIASLIAQGAGLEERDRGGRTPLLLAVHGGDRGKAELLLEKGADRNAHGNGGHTALGYAAESGQPEMLRWLLDLGFDPEETDDSGHTPLKVALLYESEQCCRILLEIEAGKNPPPGFYNELLGNTSSPAVAAMLIGHGANPALQEKETLHHFIHLPTLGYLAATEEEYLAGRFRRFGTANPERVEIPFWNAMVRCGWSAYQAAHEFGDSSCGRGNPVWSQERFGMSLTPLPDGRFIQIAGEHEDSYDPDFCIYNDVFIHDGHGNFEILAYPEEIFPPTDFHSATLVGKWIYIIGTLGYYGTRGDQTPVYRLHTDSGVIEKVQVHGESPGWIHKHHATLKNGGIRISGGKVVLQKDDGSETTEDHTGEYLFDPESGAWRRLSPAES